MADIVNPAFATAVEARGALSGLEFFRQMIAGTIPMPPMVALLGLQLVEAEAGRVVFAGTPSEDCYNGLGVVHGGYAATLIDSALGCAINSTQPAGRVFTTLELKINYTRPLRHEVGAIRCIGTVVHVGSRVGTAEARVVDAAGKLYAHGTTTCILVET
jgi:uncharacterized protein (TIGR00369 family)